MSNLMRVTVSAISDLREAFDRSRAGQTSRNRSEAVRRWMEGAASAETVSETSRDVVATPTLIYGRR